MPPDEDDETPQEAVPIVDIPNAADEASIKRRAGKARLTKGETDRFWSEALATPVGRLAVWQILSEGHAFDERFANGPNGFPQSDATWLRAGEQRLAFRLYLSWLAIDPEAVTLMLRENEPSLVAQAKVAKARR